VVVGGGIGLGGNILQRRWHLKDREEEAQQIRRDEVRARMDDKAQAILELLANLDAILSRHIVISHTTLWPDDESRQAARSILTSISIESGYLTQPLRGHVRVVVNLLPDVERLAGERWVDASARSVAYSAIRWARRNLERYIRGEPLPSERGEPIDGYVAAWDDLQEMILHQIEETDAAADREKT
jgi:hypothetical protein